MRKFLHSPLFRCLLCFIMISCIFLNCSPIRARAVVPEAVFISAGIIIGSIMIGLGVGMALDSTPTVLTNLVNTCVDSIKTTYNFIEDGLIQVFSSSTDSGQCNYYVDKSLIDAVRNWLFESETIIESNEPQYSTGAVTVTFGDNQYIVEPYAEDQFLFPVSFLAANGAHYFTVFSNGSSFYVNGSYRARSGSMQSVDGQAFNYYTIGTYTPGWEKEATGFVECSIVDGKIVFSGLSSIEGTELGHVAFLDVDLSDGYPSWSAGAISIPGTSADDDERFGYPIGIADTLDDTLNFSQEDVWTGNSSYTDVGTDTEIGTDTDTKVITKTLSEILAELRSGTISITDALSEVVAAVKSVSTAISDASKSEVTTDIDGLSLDLKDYFPFCIPFDLYDLFTCLRATPEAPVFELALPTPSGSYPFTVDLSCYDTVAEICRKLQLLLFCIGLAFETRNLIKG